MTTPSYPPPPGSPPPAIAAVANGGPAQSAVENHSSATEQHSSYAPPPFPEAPAAPVGVPIQQLSVAEGYPTEKQQSDAQPPATASVGAPASATAPALPPRHAPLFATAGVDGSEDDSYVRDPHKLVGYLVPFPAPNAGEKPPLRFLLYTPPPPPLLKPAEGDKEGMSHKVQRKWQEEVRNARQSDAKVTSWKGIKGRITKGVAWATDRTTTAQLDFLTRIPQDGKPHEAGQASKVAGSEGERHSTDGDKSDEQEGDETKATVQLEELVFIYPPSLAMTPEQIREEFVNTVLRTRKKAEKDAIIATGLLPVSAALDWALVFCGWIFGGLFEVDAVWAASSIRGAKMARSVTKRLNSSTGNGQGQLKLNFVPSPRAEPLAAYLLGHCIERDAARFRPANRALVPTEATILKAIGWQPSDQYEQHNWEDEKWEHTQVERDLKDTMSKAAKAWDKWIDQFHKHPEKALKKG